jgi:predicted RNase H-like HicB family nuclease
MRPFIAFIRKQPDIGFRVSFADLPECDSSGRTIAEAHQNATSALALHCELLHDLGAPTPRPSFMQDIVAGGGRTDGLLALIAPPEAALSPFAALRPGKREPGDRRLAVASESLLRAAASAPPRPRR